MRQLLNKYKHIWVIIYMIPYLLWYFGLQQLRTNVSFTDVYTVIDKSLPFIPLFIWPYIYWYIFVLGTALYFFFKDVKDFYKVIAFLFIGMTICLIIFTIFPSCFDHRPISFHADRLTTFFINSIYSADKCQNVFPSIHVYNSIGCAIAICEHKGFKNKKGIKAFAIISAILITLSTMFIKQHSILDVISASFIALIMYKIIYKRNNIKEL